MSAPNIISENDISLELLNSIYQEAYLKSFVDTDGDLRIEDGGRGCFVWLPESKNWVNLYCSYTVTEKTTQKKKEFFTSRFNEKYIFARAFVAKSGGITFDAFIPVEGGTTKKAIILATRAFLRIVNDGMLELDDDKIFA